jgi:hypothetical protein
VTLGGRATVSALVFDHPGAPGEADGVGLER